MSYKMPKLEDRKLLCPRCGSPLMDMGKFLKCPLCGYSKSHEAEIRTVIKYAEPDAVKKKVEPKIFQVLPSGLSAATQLESDGVYLVTDPEKNTIWLWKGTESKHKDVYNAGTAATKLKASEKLYSASLVRVEEGDEPPEFPSVSGKTAISKEMISEAQEALTVEPPPEGQANIYLIDKGELKKIDQPVFTTGDSYLVDAGAKIWIWIGEHASVDEKFSAAHLSTVIDVSRRGTPKVISVEQGME
ncbi:MAG TPA: hypothetical protein VMV49_04765, partial [Candidatus Deferrimicrobium sp.]|nr:hypothetical protein [Candidatus Deferrimicrobium sp.]